MISSTSLPPSSLPYTGLGSWLVTLGSGETLEELLAEYEHFKELAAKKPEELTEEEQEFFECVELLTEVCLCRASNTHGLKSFGWIDNDKFRIWEGCYEEEEGYEELLEAYWRAEVIADALNTAEGLRI